MMLRTPINHLILSFKFAYRRHSFFYSSLLSGCIALIAGWALPFGQCDFMVRSPSDFNRNHPRCLRYAAFVAGHRIVVFPFSVDMNWVFHTRVDSLALRGLRATQITVEVNDGDGGPLLYTFTQRLTRVGIRGWLQYFFEPFSVRDAVTLSNLPLSLHACITVTIEGGATVAVSDLIIGRSSSIGDVGYGAQASIVSYGRKDVSPSGGSRLQKGRFARQSSLHMMEDDAQKDRIFKALADLRETPCLFQGSATPGHELLTLFGIYENFSVDISYPTTSYVTLDLLGFAEKTEDS